MTVCFNKQIALQKKSKWGEGEPTDQKRLKAFLLKQADRHNWG